MVETASEWPRLRPIEPQWVQYNGRRYLCLKDPLELGDETVLVPEALVPLLGLCDGTRDAAGLRTAMALRTGVQVTPAVVAELLDRLDRALLLDGDGYRTAKTRELKAFRSSEYRDPFYADKVYPGDPERLKETLNGYCQRHPAEPSTRTNLVGLVCPHIDYARGHATYADLWQRARLSLDGTELVIVFGTDHRGGPGTITPTRQSYATPLGVLQTDVEAVDDVVDALGGEAALDEELHHANEHSIELALVWMHHFMDGRPVDVVPILCGSFHRFVSGETDPGDDDRIRAAVEALKRASAGRRTLVIAAGDLAHVGPAFGDSRPLDAVQMADVASRDEETISAICNTDAASMMSAAQRELDARRLCGLPPIYMALRYLERASGEVVGYAQCPADEAGASIVSIAGVLLYGDAAGGQSPNAATRRP